MIQRIDNFPENLVEKIEDLCFSPIPRWDFKRTTISPEQIDEVCSALNCSPNKFGEYDIAEKYWYQSAVVHGEYNVDYMVNEIRPLIDYIAYEVIQKPFDVMRLKFNMYLYSSTNAISMPHFDSLEENFVSLLYYVNDSSGDTYFFDNDKNLIDRVSPKRGTAVLFDSNIVHAGSYPKEETEPRVVMSAVFRYL
jgi:hypothetical protein